MIQLPILGGAGGKQSHGNGAIQSCIRHLCRVLKREENSAQKRNLGGDPCASDSRKMFCAERENAEPIATYFKRSLRIMGGFISSSPKTSSPNGILNDFVGRRNKLRERARRGLGRDWMR